MALFTFSKHRTSQRLAIRELLRPQIMLDFTIAREIMMAHTGYTAAAL